MERLLRGHGRGVATENARTLGKHIGHSLFCGFRPRRKCSDAEVAYRDNHFPQQCSSDVVLEEAEYSGIIIVW